MCNAWNHPAGCTCGWGGEGHLGGGGNWGGLINEPILKYNEKSVHLFSKSYDTYVNTNAKCPVCGASVYFYQSPYGGRVFFDDLGPPWPKHPCTSDIDVEINFIQGRKTLPEWQLKGWLPALHVEIADRKGNHLIAFAIIDGERNPIYEAYNYSPRTLSIIKNSDFLFYRKIDELSFEIASYCIIDNIRENFILKKRAITQQIYFTP